MEDAINMLFVQILKEVLLVLVKMVTQEMELFVMIHPKVKRIKVIIKQLELVLVFHLVSWD